MDITLIATWPVAARVKVVTCTLPSEASVRDTGTGIDNSVWSSGQDFFPCDHRVTKVFHNAAKDELALVCVRYLHVIL